MRVRLVGVLSLCLITALSAWTLQEHETAFASRLSVPDTSSRINAVDLEFAASLVEQVAQNSETISFRATKTVILWYPSGTSACISNIMHKAPNLTRTEYLPSSASDCGFRTVISDGNSTWHYEPSLQVVFHMSDSFSLPDNRDISLIKANYNISLVTTDNLAGREAYVIKLEPRHPGNPWRIIWVDREYPFILRTEKYRPDGAMSSVSFYNWIEFFPVLNDSLFELDIPPNVAKVELPVSGDIMPLARLEEEANFFIPVPEFVPPGYMIEGGILSLYKAFPSAHIRLTDGLNTISYFVSPKIAGGGRREDNMSEASDLLEMISRERKVPIDGTQAKLGNYQDAKFLRWSREGYEFTLVGEVDESILIEVAQSIDVPHIPHRPDQQSFSEYLTRFLYQLFWIDR